MTRLLQSIPIKQGNALEEIEKEIETFFWFSFGLFEEESFACSFLLRFFFLFLLFLPPFESANVSTSGKFPKTQKTLKDGYLSTDLSNVPVSHILIVEYQYKV
jgi:hypothetical protein